MKKSTFLALFPLVFILGTAQANTLTQPKNASALSSNISQNEKFKALRKAALQENAMAQANLGIAYHIGYAVEKNYSLAAKWYRKAALQGNV